MRYIAYTSAALLVLALVLVAAVRHMDVVERNYRNVAALRSDGGVSRGWVSEAIPDSAADIQLTTNLDTNEAWARFVVPRSVERELALACPMMSLAGSELVRRSNAAWWPVALMQVAASTPSNAKFFRCADGGIFAVLEGSTAVFFWRHAGGD